MKKEFIEWEFEESSNGVDFLITPKGRALPIFITCEERMSVNYQDKEQALKDTRLAAAAPELLEALNDIIYAFDVKMGKSAINVRIEIAKNAIKKATE